MDRALLLQTTGLATASDYQVAIFEEFRKNIQRYLSGEQTESLVVKATAGSGKTTTIVSASRLIPASRKIGVRIAKIFTLFVAFNKDIVTELKPRLPQNVEVRTFNSLGYSIYLNYYKGLNNGAMPTVDAYKVQKIMRNLMSPKQREEYGEDVRFLVSMAKSMGIVPNGANGARSINGYTDNDQTWMNILSHYDKYIPVQDYPTVINFVRQILLANLKDRNTIDFDDQKYFAVCLVNSDGSPLPAFKNDFIIGDEIQDTNAVDLALIKMALKDNGVVLGVGDKRQAIYGFRGADVYSIEKFKKAFNANELPLTISYRCSKNVVAHAAEVFPEIEAHQNAAEGTVVRHGNYKVDIFQPGDMILCRNNGPLVSFAYKLINNRKKVIVKGRDIGKGLIRIIEKLEATNVADLGVKLNEWRANQIEIILADNPDNESAVQRINDVNDCIKVFMTSNVDNLVSSVIRDIEALFSDDISDAKNLIILSSMHKSKGLESDRVHILDSGLLYQYVDEDTWQYEQEKNLDFVARTRAKTYLSYVSSNRLVA